MTAAALQQGIRDQVKAFERRLSRLGDTDQKRVRAELRESHGVYYRRSYTVSAAFCKLPKRRRRS